MSSKIATEPNSERQQYKFVDCKCELEDGTPFTLPDGPWMVIQHSDSLKRIIIIPGKELTITAASLLRAKFLGTAALLKTW